MAIKPTDIVNWKNVGQTLEDEIDATLKKEWKGLHAVRFDLPKNLPSRIIDELKERYIAAGWNVSYSGGDCQREGPWSYLEFREAKS